MGWLQSRRLHYWLGATAIAFVLFALLRVVFFFGFSGFDANALSAEPAVPETLGIGFRFDLRLAILRRKAEHAGVPVPEEVVTFQFADIVGDLARQEGDDRRDPEARLRSFRHPPE